MAAMQYFVSPSGNDSNPGTISQPFQSISRGVDALMEEGDTLNLREGVYVEHVEIKEKNGVSSNNIVIRSHSGEHAIIDGCVKQFREVDNDDWEEEALFDASMSTALPDTSIHLVDYVSRDAFGVDRDTDASDEEKDDEDKDDLVNRGAFLNLDDSTYTRLITYSRLEDLRANNQTFDQIDPGDERPGPDELVAKGGDKKTYVPTGFRRPWVYMGPGIFFDKKTRRIHIRLAHTNNNVGGIEDYTGPMDPRKIRLAISHSQRTTLIIRKCSNLRIENLSIRFGGQHTIRLHNTNSIVFDHVRIRASTNGIMLEEPNETTEFRHCEFDGGLPTWYFRSDRKAQYHFRDADGSVQTNNLGKKTMGTLLDGSPASKNITIRNCEFVNGHDLYLFGSDIDFHHNWIDNLNDDAMVVDLKKTFNLAIFQNVIMRCISAMSFDGKELGGPKFIYCNLFDLRGQIAERRPRFPKSGGVESDQEVFGWGQFYKPGEPDGKVYLFQNTCLVSHQHTNASYMHYFKTTGSSDDRYSINNIFVAINTGLRSDKRISYIPSTAFPAATDGNCYFRIGLQTAPLLGSNSSAAKFPHLQKDFWGSDLFNQSKMQYLPGYEAQSIEGDPRFRSMAPDGRVQFTDDFRLRPDSPARNSGVSFASLASLGGAFVELKKRLTNLGLFDANPDIGCYQSGAGSFRVGVDGRHEFPKATFA